MELEKKSSEKISPDKKEKNTDELISELKTASENLFYISETDAPFEPFVWKTDAPFAEIKAEDVLKLAGQKPDAKVSEKTLDEFFKQPTEIQDWFGDEEKEQVEKFKKLKELLANRLKSAKVFKIGEIQIDIYAVGIDSEGNLTGVKTKAVET
jgi:hypothetical protein